jgi:hypothetical protein
MHIIALLMPTRILDTTEIDLDDQEIQSELEADLRRMDRLPHPENATAYQVLVRPSKRTYMPGLHRFVYVIQYGILYNGEFQPEGDIVRYQTETLPMI